MLFEHSGLCNNNIKPSVTPSIVFGMEADSIVMAIRVSKGLEPVYYVGGRPKLRHLTESRGANPSEVVELIRTWLDSTQGRKALAAQLFFERAIAVLADTRIVVREAPQRDCNPWVDLAQAQLEEHSKVFRQLSFDATAHDTGLTIMMGEIGEDLDSCAQLCRASCWPEYLDGLKLCQTKLLAFRSELLKYERRFPVSEFDVGGRVEVTKRKLQDLLRRSPKLMEQGRLDELQFEGPALGREILKIVLHPLATESDINEEAARIGHAMSIMDIETTYADGGQSYERIGNEICELAHKFLSLRPIEYRDTT